MSGHADKRSVIVSIISGVCIAVFKIIVGLISGSSALISEAVHSCVDAFNSVFLLVGERASRRPADAQHPFGYGREMYFWTVVVAVSIFAGGGAVSAYQGIHHLVEPEPLAPSGWSYTVLAVAAVFEVWTTIAAYREFRAVPGHAEVSLWQAFRDSTDLTTFVVLFENGAAVLGLVIAACGIALSQILGRHEPDAIASLLIGVLLGVVAFVLIRESKGLVVGEGINRPAAREMRSVIESNPNVEEVLDLLTLNTGPGEVLAAMDLRFRPDLTTDLLADVIDEVENALRARFPDVKRIFVEADRIVHTRRAGTQPHP
jgi:cation diffusion facilitator family transporter